MREPESPYKGLAPFDDSELDALLFFGREREREIIVANLMASRLTVLYGPSGVGKTSLLRAGVAHQLRSVPDVGVVVFGTWAIDPAAGLAEAVGATARPGETLADALAGWTARESRDLFVILDQLEEYFLYHGRDAFEREFPDAVTRPDVRANFLLAIREEELASLDAFKGRIPNLFGNYLRLDHLDRASARKAIVGPVEQFNRLVAGAHVTIEPELVEEVVRQVGGGRVDLGQAGKGVAKQDGGDRVEAPYLQLVMQRLWDAERESGSSALRLETLNSLGGAAEIVRVHLGRAVEGLTQQQRDVAADAFHHLVTPSGTKIAHGADDLAQYAGVGERELIPVLDALTRERILRTIDEPSAQNGARYEIFHDVLAEPVLAWRAQQQLERQKHEADRRHRRVVAIASAALLALAAVTAVALFALVQRERARDAARRAHARELAAQANLMLTVDPAQSVALAVRAARLEPSADVERQLRNAVIGSRVRGIFQARDGAVTEAAMSPDGSRVAVASAAGWIRVFDTPTIRKLAEFRHPGRVTGLVFSRDGRLLVSAATDGTARFWRPDQGRLLRMVRHRGAVTSVSLSRDGLWLATGSRDRTAKVWLVASGTPLSEFRMPGPVTLARFSPAADRVAAVSGGSLRLFAPLTGRLLRAFDQPGTIAAIDFSASGRLLATAGADKVARVWRLDPPGLHLKLPAHLGRVVDVSFSPRGTLLATASTDGTARVWNVGRGTLKAPLLGHRNHVYTARFSSDGYYVITASRDQSARVWNAESGKTQAILYGHRGSVTRAAFVPGGTSALTRSEDGTARIWDASAQPELQELGRHRAPVTSVSFGSDVRTVLSAGADGNAQLWRRGKIARTFSHGASLTDAALREDHELVVTTGVDGIARVWPLNGGAPRVLRHGGAITAVAVSSDADQLATAGRDGLVRVWSIATGRLVRTLRHRAPVLDVAFDPAGSRLATAGADGVARIWSDEQVVHELRGHTDDVTSVAFGPMGRLLVTASRDHDVRIWNTESGDLVRLLQGHFALVNEAAFSADARWIVTAGPGTAGLWEVRSGSLPFFLRGHEGVLNSAAFAPRGHRIVTGGEDGTIRTYRCDVCGGVRDLLRLAERRLAAARR